MKTLTTTIIGLVALLLVATQASAFPVAVKITNMEINGSYGGVDAYREAAYIHSLAHPTPGYCMKVYVTGPDGYQQLYPHESVEAQQHVIERDPGSYRVGSGCADSLATLVVDENGCVSPNEVVVVSDGGEGMTAWMLLRFSSMDGNCAGGGAGADGAQGEQGPQGADGATGSTGADGAAGDAGAAGAAAPCTPCDDVANAAVNLACIVLNETQPTNIQELTDAATVIVDSLMISTNICEGTCDIGAGIQAAIDAKLNP